MIVRLILFIVCITAFLERSYAQDKTGIFSNITLGQSMATSEQEALPAQFAVTLPKDKPASFLVNAGISVDFATKSRTFISSFTGEYHRNSLTDSVQNNFQFGYKGYYNFKTSSDKETKYVFIFDPQYSRDVIAQKHSFQSNLLLTWYNNGKDFNFGGVATPNESKSAYTKVSLLVGAQVQDVFHADSNVSLQGFKLRPLAIADAGLYFTRKHDITDPLIGISAGFTQRIAVVNTTADPEKYTHQFRAALNYYIVSKPAAVSIGVNFLSGSDPFTGLKQQQYFLLAFNVFLGK